MDLQTIRELDIAMSTIYYAPQGIQAQEDINYSEWVKYIDLRQDYFTWAENTEEGKETLANIDKVPESFRERTLMAYSKNRCYAEYNSKKKYYDITVSNYDQKIGISFERKVTKEDLMRLLDMAKSLGAYLLNNGNEIIDEKVLDDLK